MTVEQVPIAPDLFTWPADEPQLIGGKCTTCGVVTFPKQGSCPRCNGQEIEPELLARQGTLWTWTIQGFLPKSPPYAGPETAKDFQGYGVGYVELPGEVKVETRLTENDPAKLDDRHADGAGHRPVHPRRGRPRGRHVRVRAGRRRAS